MRMNARELMQTIALATLCVSLVIVVIGEISLLLLLHDGEQTAALQQTFLWILPELIAGLAVVAGLPHWFASRLPQDTPAAPTRKKEAS
jgi:biotin transporter BioY